MAKILLIEDEDSIRKIIAYDLRNANHEITEAKDGQEAISFAIQENFDVCIIDWMLPKISGIAIVEQLREANTNSILIMLTARDDESDILHAFEKGVDDYITKPFSPRELLARVHAHLKRKPSPSSAQSFSIGNVFMDTTRRIIKIKDVCLTLTKKEFDLLKYLIQHQEIVLSRDKILNEIWGFDYDGDTRIVDVHIFKLRSKLTASNIQIKSMRGIGYSIEVVHEKA